MATLSLSEAMKAPPATATTTTPTDSTPKQDFYSVNLGGKTILLPNADNRGQQLSANDAITAYQKGTLTSIKEFDKVASPEEVGAVVNQRPSSLSSSGSSLPSGGSSSRKTSSPTDASDATTPNGAMTLMEAFHGGKKAVAPAVLSRQPRVESGGGLNLPATILLSKFDDPQAVRGFLDKKYGDTWKSEDFMNAKGHEIYGEALKAGYKQALGRGFFDKTSDTLAASWESIKEHPITTTIGAGKALVSGVEGVLEFFPSAAHTLEATARALLTKEDPTAARKQASITDAEISAKVHHLAENITGINLTPTGKEDEAMARMLGMPIDAIKATGLTVTEQTGSQILGATTEGIGTAALFKPGLAADMLRVIPRGKSAATHAATFADLLKKNREEAFNYADTEVAKTDPELAKRMKDEALTQPGKHPDGTPVVGLTPKQIADAAATTGKVAARVTAIAAAGAKVEAAFDGLVIKDKKLAEQVADHVAVADPKLGKELKDKTKGRTTQAKIDEAAQAAIDADAFMADTIKGKDSIVPTRSSIIHDAGKALDGERARADKAKGDEYKDSKIHSEWKHASAVLDDILIGREDIRVPDSIEIRNTGSKPGHTTAHELLDHILQYNLHPGIEGILTKIRQRVDNIPVHFGKEVVDEHGETTGGLYDPIHHSVLLSTKGSNTVKMAAHEFVHAYTTRWLYGNKGHTLYTQMEALLNETIRRAKLAKISKVDMYGLTDVHEFVSEAMTNPNFQKFLIESERYRSPHTPPDRGILNKLSEVIQKLFGVKDPKQAELFNQIIQNVEDVADAQKLAPPPKWASNQLESVYKVGRQPTTNPLPSSDRVSAGIRDSVKEVSEAVDNPKASPIDNAFSAAAGFARKSNTVRLGESKLRQYIEQAQRTFSPESLGPEAKVAAASIAKAMSEEAQKTSAYFHDAKVRKAFWDSNAAGARDFIARFESGETFSDPTLQKAAEGYRQWNARILDQDTATGFNYEPVDHYLMHVFKDNKAVEDYFNTKYGKKWGDPAFIKARTFSLYEEAIKKGFIPKYTNPEDIMLARQHASDVAQMREQVLGDMVQYGLGVKVIKTRNADGTVKTTPRPKDYSSTYWRSPTGDGYWIHNTANVVMDNAFNSKSLWNEQGIVGDTFRGTMFLKNAIVPVKLALSLFHPLHVVGIDNAATMMRSSKGLLSGTVNPVRWMADMVKSGLLYESLPFVGKNTRLGSRVLEAWQGKIKGENLSAADRQALVYMGEGGFIPEMSAQYRTGAVEKFTSALRQHKASTLWHATFAAIDMIQRPIFERWIPGLKIASYLHDVDMALKADPSLLENGLNRQMAFRKLAKSVDNRYGEMAYNTLFWNKWVKDLSVASTLSLGWNLGFLREYGGGAMDLGQAVTTKGGLPGKAAKGTLDRPMFVLAYTTTALAYGGLMTYALSGKMPQGLVDYVYPQTGGTDPDGKPKRANTMFYTREFGSIYSHVKNEGLVSGGLDVIKSKASPLFDMAHSFFSNKNFYNQEISDPNAPAYKQLEQRVAYTLSAMEPIGVGASRKGDGSFKDVALNIAGFSKAPKYATETGIEGEVAATFTKYFPQPITPYEKAALSTDAKKLRQLYNSNDPAYDDALGAIADKHKLTEKEMDKLTKSFEKNENPNVKLFQRLSWQDQKRILDKHWHEMTEGEQTEYLIHSNKEHLRDDYEPPVEGK